MYSMYAVLYNILYTAFQTRQSFGPIPKKISVTNFWWQKITFES